MTSIEEICRHSFRDFHVKGFDYLCLHRSEQVTVKAYFFDGPTVGSPEVVMPHNHRYGFTTTVLAGGLLNREWSVVDGARMAMRERHTRVFQEFDYLTPLLGGDGFTWRREVLLAENLLSSARMYRRGETYLSQPSDVHTLGRIEPGTVIVLTQLEDVVPVGVPTQAYRSGLGHEGPSLDGLYSRMPVDHALRRLAQLERLGWPVPEVE